MLFATRINPLPISTSELRPGEEVVYLPACALDVCQSGFFELDVPGTEASNFYLNTPTFFFFVLHSTFLSFSQPLFVILIPKLKQTPKKMLPSTIRLAAVAHARTPLIRFLGPRKTLSDGKCCGGPFNFRGVEI